MPGLHRRTTEPTTTSPADDEFTRLGAAVARILREAFTTAEAVRAMGAADVKATAAQAEAEAISYVHAAKDVPSRMKQQADHVIAQLQQTAARLPTEHQVDDAPVRRAEQEAKAIVDKALEAQRQAMRQVEDMLVEAQARAAAMRQQALADSRTIVEQAEQRLATATAAVEEHRTVLADETKRLLSQLRATVAKAQDEMTIERVTVIKRAEDEAAAIVQQARLHHAAAAREATRMIDAATKQAADLREMAVQDGMTITVKAREVADRLVREAADVRARRLGSLADQPGRADEPLMAPTAASAPVRGHRDHGRRQNPAGTAAPRPA